MRRATPIQLSRSQFLICGFLALFILLCLWSLSTSFLRNRKLDSVISTPEIQQQQQSLRRTVTTEATNDGDEPLWSNPYDLVHVIQTRFMQFQPNLVALGRARLELLRVITLTSLQNQTSPDFLWIIRTDPDLEVSLRLDLVEMLEASPVRVVLIASNKNPEGFRSPDCIGDVTADSVWVGSVEIAQAYHEAAQSRTVLETRLDADDALALEFVESLQQRAAATLTEAWRVWCIRSHMEWQYESLFEEKERGTLLGARSKQCVTAGLTWGYTVGTSRRGIEVSQHHKIHKSIPTCSNSELNPGDEEEEEETDDSTGDEDAGNAGTEEEAGDGAGDEEETDEEPAEEASSDALRDDRNVADKNRTSHCLDRWLPANGYPAALRGRTPTSAGMDRVVTNKEEKARLQKHLKDSKWNNMQDSLWKAVPILFGIQPDEVWAMRAYFHEHLAELLADAVVGLCTPGHSCKNTTREVLNRLLNETTSGATVE